MVAWIDKECNITIDSEQVIATETPSIWILAHVGVENVKGCIERLQGRRFGKKRFISATPMTQTTPVRRSLGIRTPGQDEEPQVLQRKKNLEKPPFNEG